jgi:protein-histidine pros-kinase
MLSSELVRSALESAPDAIVIADAAGAITAVNARAERLFGYDPGELPGRDVGLLFSSARPPAAGMPVRGRRRDGDEFPIEVTSSPLAAEGGPFTISAIRDISERTRADQKFRSLLESAPDAMVIVDRAGTIVLVNAQTERVFGYPREELLGQSVELLVPARYNHAHVAHRLGYFTAAHPRPMGMGLELYGRRKDGTEVPVEISLSPLRTEEGLLVASAIRDITDRKAADAERARLVRERAAHAEANRVKDEFLATLSHELRTPLNAMLGWMTLIGTGSLSEDGVERAHATISRNARALAQLVDDLLDVSRIVSGKLRVQRAALDLAEVAEAALEIVAPAAAAKEIHLQAHFQSRPILVVGDADRLQQVIWNLLSNAVKFTPPHGRVELHVRPADDRVEILVRDTGQGISPAFLPHVFDRFRQADGTSTRPQGGLGLGLAIARSIVELHGGTIAAASSGPGLGAAFRIELPIAALSERRARPRAPADLAAIRGARILVVDDQEDERVLVSTIFEQVQAEVRAAASVRAAFDLLAGWRPDLIVSDLAMPHEDGYLLMRRISQSVELRDIPVLAVTAHARPEDREAALAAGFRAYVSKPLDRGLLLARAASLIAVTSPLRKNGPH